MKTIKTTLMSSLLILSAVLFIGCDHKEHGGEEHIYSVVHPWRRDLEIVNEYVAQIHAYQHIELRAFERGYLQNIYVDEGQQIEKDQKMFQLMPMVLQAEYDKAKAEYDVVRIEYKNTKNLYDKKVVSKNEFALSKAKLAKAKAQLDLAKTHLDFTTIKAPFSGIMDRFRVRLGSLVDEGQLVTTLSDISKMWVYFNVSEADYLTYKQKHKNDSVKSKVRLRLANGTVFAQEGEIDTIEADFNNVTGNVAFRATFQNPDMLLRHGETGNILITDNIKDALVIPQKATFEVLDQKFVYVINKDGVVKTRHIVVSHEVPHLYAISKGLEEGDTVVIEGIGKIQPDKKVKTKLEDVASIMKGLEEMVAE